MQFLQFLYSQRKKIVIFHFTHTVLVLTHCTYMHMCTVVDLKHLYAPLPQSTDTDPEDLLQSLLCLRAEIRSSTSSMTSVPKPLKLLTSHYTQLKDVYHNMVTHDDTHSTYCHTYSIRKDSHYAGEGRGGGLQLILCAYINFPLFRAHRGRRLVRCWGMCSRCWR